MNASAAPFVDGQTTSRIPLIRELLDRMVEEGYLHGAQRRLLALFFEGDQHRDLIPMEVMGCIGAIGTLVMDHGGSAREEFLRVVGEHCATEHDEIMRFSQRMRRLFGDDLFHEWLQVTACIIIAAQQAPAIIHDLVETHHGRA